MKGTIEKFVNAIVASIDQINISLSKFINEKKDYDNKNNAHWGVTRNNEQRLAIVEEKMKKFEELNNYLKSDDPMRPGVLKQIDIRLQRLENTISISNENLKRELETFKTFIMKIIYMVSGGITVVIAIAAIVTWFINNLKGIR